MNAEKLYRNRREDANWQAVREVQRALPQKSVEDRARIVNTRDSTSNSEGDRFCRLTRNRCVRRRGLFDAYEQAGTNRRADANGSRSLHSRNHTHYVAGSVVQTDIHHPTDSALLWDAVRVITRLVQRLGEIIPRGVSTFHNRTRAAKRRHQQIQRMTSAQRQTRLAGKYRELIEITEEVVQSAHAVLEKTKEARLRDVLQEALLRKLRQEIAHYGQLGERVLDQTRRRVLEGEQVPNSEKLFSLFEPHTDLIKRGKPRTPEEFGHKVFLAESAQGLITQYEVLEGNPADQDQVEASLLHHQATFDRPPYSYAADRGFHSVDNEKACKVEGVKQVSIPQRGGQKTPRRQAYEKTPAFKQGQRFRSGIEGRISVLFRGRGMKRCRAKGRERFELFVGAAVLANNLLRIAALLLEKKKKNSRRSKAAA